MVEWNLLRLKIGTARYRFTLETRKGIFTVWHDNLVGDFYLQEKRPKYELIYTITADKMSEGKLLLENNNKLLQLLRSSFRQGQMYFDKPSTRNAFIDIFRSW